MPVQITIIGLGQVGSSMGLALKPHQESILRIGHDKRADVENEALKRGAFDKVEHHLISAVKDARLVVLALPVSQVRETLGLIAADLKPGTVVLDTCPVKSDVAKSAKEILPENCYYVGLVPALAAESLHDLKFGLDAARPDLFTNSLFLVNTPPRTPEEAMVLAMDFVRLLGAEPLLSDMIESDGLMSSIHLLPQLVAASMLNATIDQPGWQDARKMAGRAYAAVSAGLAYQDEIDSLRMSVMQSRASVVRSLDVTIAALRGLRDDIEKGDDDGIAARLESALEGRKRWFNERKAADWKNEMRSESFDMPSFSERLFGGAFEKRSRKK